MVALYRRARLTIPLAMPLTILLTMPLSIPLTMLLTIPFAMQHFHFRKPHFETSARATRKGKQQDTIYNLKIIFGVDAGIIVSNISVDNEQSVEPIWSPCVFPQI